MAVYPPGCVAGRVNMAADTFKGGSGTLNLLTAALLIFTDTDDQPELHR